MSKFDGWPRPMTFAERVRAQKGLPEFRRFQEEVVGRHSLLDKQGYVYVSEAYLTEHGYERIRYVLAVKQTACWLGCDVKDENGRFLVLKRHNNAQGYLSDDYFPVRPEDMPKRVLYDNLPGLRIDRR